MGSFLLAAGEPGMRVALTNSRIMVHQPSGGAQGMAADIEIQAREILRMRQRLNELYAKYTGQKIEEIEKAMDRDKFLEADEAKAFGHHRRSVRHASRTGRGCRHRRGRCDAGVKLNWGGGDRKTRGADRGDGVCRVAGGGGDG